MSWKQFYGSDPEWEANRSSISYNISYGETLRSSYGGIDYQLAWKKLRFLINEKLIEAQNKDEEIAYNGGYSNYAREYKDFLDMMDLCERSDMNGNS